MNEPRVRLILGDPRTPFEQLSAVWSQIHKVPMADAAQRLRRTWGVLDEGTSSAELETFRSAYLSAGIAVRLVLPEHWPRLPDPQGIQKMPPNPQRMDILAACSFEETTASVAPAPPSGPSKIQRAASIGILLTTGMPVRIGPKKEKNPKAPTAQTVAHLWIEMLGGSPLQRLRVNAREFDYSCLGAQKGFSAILNARALLKQWVESSPKAELNLGARSILEGRSGPLPYHGLEDLEKELQWLQALRTTS